MKFSEYVKGFKENEIKNDFDNILLQYIKDGRKGKPLNWELLRPFVSKDKNGKPTGNGFIKYTPLEDFKDKLEEVLTDPNLIRENVIKDYRRIFIENALLINDVNNIYKEITNKLYSPSINGTLQSQYIYSYTKLAVKELIRFEKYLNELKNKPQKKELPPVKLSDFFPNLSTEQIENLKKEFSNSRGIEMACFIHQTFNDGHLVIIKNSIKNALSKFCRDFAQMTTKEYEAVRKLFKYDTYSLDNENYLRDYNTKDKTSKALRVG